jgi:hypothetical protein
LEDDLGFGLLGESGLDLSGKSVGVDVLSLEVGGEPLEFGLGAGDPAAQFPRGGDFVGFQVSEGGSEGGFQIIEDREDSFGDGSASAAGGLFFTFDFFLVVVGQLEEGVDFSLAEDVAVHLELVGHGLDLLLGHLVQFEGVAVDDVARDVLLQEMDDLEGFLVVPEGPDEELVAEALVVEEGLDLPVDLVLSEFVPGDVVLGGNELLFESDSVLLGLGEQLLVEVLHFGEFGDGGGSNHFVSLVLSVSSELGIEVGLLEVLQEVEDGVNSVAGLGSGLEQSEDLLLSAGCCECRSNQ